MYKLLHFNDIKLLDENVSGVYSITNILNNHRYIGSSNNIKTRLYIHFNKLKYNKHYNNHLQSAYNKYGYNNFVFQILELCDPIRDTLFYIEQKYLDLNPEYNILNIAGSFKDYKHTIITKNKFSKDRKGVKFTEEHKNNLSKSLYRKGVKSVIQYDLDNNFLREHKSIIDAEIYLNIPNSRKGISSCCKGNRLKSYGYIWKFKKIK